MREIEALHRRAEQQRRGELSIAWHTAALSRTKRMPRHERLVGGGSRQARRRRSTTQEQIAKARQITELLRAKFAKAPQPVTK